MKKKVLSSILAISLLSTQLSAASLKDFVLFNRSSATTASTDGKHYYFGGNYNVKFKTNTYAFKPLFNGQPPRIHMGCDGISISGGFVSLLGLDDIKKQLNHASTAFAWGLIMGIKATIPLVGQVFETIQKWARTIQYLLQHMCQLGQTLSKEKFAQKENAKETEYAADSGFAKVKDILNSGADKADDIKKRIDNYIKNGSTNAKATAGNILAAKVKGKTISLAAFYFGEYLPSLEDSPDQVGIVDDLYDVLVEKSIGGKDLDISNTDEFNRAVLFYKLTLLCFGDLGVSKHDFESLITTTIDSTGKLNADKLKSTVLKSLRGTSPTKGFNTIPLPPALSTSNVVTFLMDGASEVNSSACKSDGNCKIPDYQFLYLDTPTSAPVNDTQDSSSSTTDDKDKNILKVFTLTASKGSNTINFQWKGFYQESLDAIRNSVQVNSSVRNYKFIGDAPATVVSGNQFVFKGIGKYVKILGMLAKKRGGETPYILYLEKLLAKKNAQIQTYLFVNNLASYITVLMKDPDINIGKATRQALSDYLNRIQQVQKIMEDKIKAHLEIDDSMYKLDLMFNEIYKSIKEDNLNNIGF